MPPPTRGCGGNILNRVLPAPLARKLATLQALLQNWPRVVVLLSGGVDSSCLLRAAVEVLGSEVLAVTFTGPHIPAEEIAVATKLAQSLHVRQRLEDFDPFHLPDFRHNTPARCYVCKQALYRRAWEIAAAAGAAAVLDGANAEDAAGDRPGLRAAAESGIRSPLRETNWQKEEIRALSHFWDLPTWDAPSQSCLATRFPTGTPISPTDLQKVEEVEAWLRHQGFGPVRLRVHGILVRLELPPEQWPQVLQPERRAALQQRIAAQGWRYLTLDLRGYQSGSMNAQPAETTSPMAEGKSRLPATPP